MTLWAGTGGAGGRLSETGCVKGQTRGRGRRIGHGESTAPVLVPDWLLTAETVVLRPPSLCSGASAGGPLRSPPTLRICAPMSQVSVLPTHIPAMKQNFPSKEASPDLHYRKPVNTDYGAGRTGAWRGLAWP